MVATTKRSHVQALNWLLASNRGDAPNGDTVGDLGAYFGSLNIERTHRNMEAQLRRALFFQRLFAPGDVKVKVIPIDLNEVLVTARLFGEYVEDTVEEQKANYDQILCYIFPFGTAKLQKVDVPEA